MTNKPLLVLPVPGAPVQRSRRFGGGGTIRLPERGRQGERLQPKLDALRQSFEAQRVRAQADGLGIASEEVVVLETVGSVENFLNAVSGVAGMEWLGEIDERDIPPDEDFFELRSSGEPRLDKLLSGRLLLVFTNQSALDQLLSMWQRWLRGEPLPYGLAVWGHVFEKLRDVRRWDYRDRLIESGVLDDWRDRIDHGQEAVPCEIELWFHTDPDRRVQAASRIRDVVDEHGGQVISECLTEQIRYHALLAWLPVGIAAALVSVPGADVALIRSEQVRVLRATGQAISAPIADDVFPEPGPDVLESDPATDPPIVALLDGLPLEQHALLSGRLVVDDPDDFGSNYEAHLRRHGTGMASLILRGNLDSAGRSLSSSLYVRPILRPDPRDWRSSRESVPENILIVDLIHRAVRRLFVPEGEARPVAPTVRVVNLSIGICDCPFDSALSPLARLLDWLAWEYKVLFVVSAGNHSHDLIIPVAIQSLSPDDIQHQVISAITTDNRNRRLLSPAESVNAITVGSQHSDAWTGQLPLRTIDPYIEKMLPSYVSGQGLGFRRSVKPDILAEGGRVVFREPMLQNPPAQLSPYLGTLAPGQRTAAPGPAGVIDRTIYSRGTSNAAAVASRGAALISKMLADLRGEPGSAVLQSVPESIWIKALLAHSADWGSAYTCAETNLKSSFNGASFREFVSRLLGYGVIDVNKVLECTDYRVTALGGGALAAENAHLHRFLLPPSLSGVAGFRKLAITLAWFTPINAAHRAWRRADLWFTPPVEKLTLLRSQADWRAVQRGTLQHEVLVGSKAAAFIDGDYLEVQVSCRADAGTLDVEVPYALAITLEIAEEIGIPIYQEIRERVQAQIQVGLAG